MSRPPALQALNLLFPSRSWQRFQSCANSSAAFFVGAMLANIRQPGTPERNPAMLVDSLTLRTYATYFPKLSFTSTAIYSLAQITLPSGVTSINADAFYNCYGMAFYDFTACTAVPTLSNKNAFNGIPADCEIRVPAALADEWKAATNWATYANYIVGV